MDLFYLNDDRDGEYMAVLPWQNEYWSGVLVPFNNTIGNVTTMLQLGEAGDLGNNSRLLAVKVWASNHS